jgi:RNA polymerase sigma-70 factor (ECF subfamily)
MTNEPKELKRLIKGCIKGKEKDYKTLYHKYYGFLLSVCLRYARDREEAKDILQLGYMRIFKNLHQYSQTGSFEGWMKRIMVNESINFFKRVNKENRTQYHDDMALIGTYDDRSTSAEVYGQFEYNELLKLVHELSPAYRTVFNLFAIDGYSHKEIAEELGIAESTSKSNLARARAILQEKVLANNTIEQKKIADYAKQ